MCTSTIRYFIAKCDTFTNLQECQKSGTWAAPHHDYPPQPSQVLRSAFHSSGSVVIIFSVNASKGWQGYAYLTSSPSDQYEVIGDRGKWYRFNVKWEVTFFGRFRNGLSFTNTESLLMSETKLGTHHLEGASELTEPVMKTINRARNWEELDVIVGKQMTDMLDLEYKNSQEVLSKLEDRKLGYITNPVFFKISDSDTVSITEQDLWDKLTHNLEGHGRIILSCPFGSHRYNTKIDTSDLDMFVVYVANTRQCLSLTPPALILKNRTLEQPDFTIYELYKYTELLANGDPKVVETLFLDPSVIHFASNEFKDLLQLRDFMLSKDLVNKYLSDALGNKGVKQLKKWESSNATLNTPKVFKVLYIVLRLLFHAKQITFCEEYSVYFSDGSYERNMLMDIRNQKCEYSQIMKIIDSLKCEIESKLSSIDCKLKQSCDSKHIEEWMLRIRYENMQEI